jgi:hypothetical protein
MGRDRQPTEIAFPPSCTRSGTRVSLLGGPADGRIVEVQFLEDAVAVHKMPAGQLAALASDAPVPDGHSLGIYEFVGGPRGPERPVFIYRTGARIATDQPTPG